MQGRRVEQRFGLSDRGRLVVRGELERRADRLGVEFAEKDQRFGRDVVLRVEALPGAPARDANRAAD
jgi:hypothetical protein